MALTTSQEEGLHQPFIEDANALSRGTLARSHSIIDVVALHHPRRASVKDTSVIILSIYVGLGLLSQPYGLRVGGWMGLLALSSTAALFFTSAMLLSKACDALPLRCPRTYPVLGYITMGGQVGRHIVSMLAVLELFGSVTIAIVIVFQQVQLLLPLPHGLFDLDSQTIAYLIIAVGLIPSLFIKNVSTLSPIAAAGSTASGAVAVVILSLIPLDPGRKYVHQPPSPHALLHWPDIVQSIGIFAVSMSGHSCLPALRSSMARPKRFSLSLGISFATMAGVYASVSAAGYYYWGDDVSPIATWDLATNSAYSSSESTPSSHGSSWHHMVQIDKVLAGLVLITCSAKIPALVIVIDEMVRENIDAVLNPHRHHHSLVGGDAAEEEQEEEEEGHNHHSNAACRHTSIYRLIISSSALALAILAHNKVGIVLSLIGGACSMATSMLLPVIFYSRLVWTGLKIWSRSLLITLLCVGFAVLVHVTYVNCMKLLYNS